MKSLPTLLKLAQRQIDEIGIEIAKIQTQVDEMNAKKAMFIARAESEMSMINDLNFVGAGAVAPYLARHKMQVQMIDADIEQVEASMESVRERLMDAYREKARLETLERLHKEKKFQEFKAREQAALDEAALTRRR